MSRRKLRLTQEQWDRLQAAPKPRCPRWIGAEARAIWKATAPGLKRKGHLTAVDGPAFAIYCICVRDHRHAVAELAACTNPHDQKLWARMERTSRRLADMYARAFYLPKMPPLSRETP